jgi:ribosomal protein S18 acetylase RimI-like enzyme
MAMKIRHATLDDIPFLAEFNHQLQEDERAPRLMSNMELVDRLTGWMEADYEAVLFELPGVSVAYALYRPTEEGMYIRQFCVLRSHQRRALGRRAIALFRKEIIAANQALYLEAYVHNEEAIAFWQALGFRQHTISFRLEPSGTR